MTWKRRIQRGWMREMGAGSKVQISKQQLCKMKDEARRLRAVRVFSVVYRWFEDSFHTGRTLGLLGGLGAICVLSFCVCELISKCAPQDGKRWKNLRIQSVLQKFLFKFVNLKEQVAQEAITSTEKVTQWAVLDTHHPHNNKSGLKWLITCLDLGFCWRVLNN